MTRPTRRNPLPFSLHGAPQRVPGLLPGRDKPSRDKYGRIKSDEPRAWSGLSPATAAAVAAMSREVETEWMGKPVFIGDERKSPGLTLRCIYCLLDADTPATVENCQELGGMLTSDDELAEAASALPPALYRAHLAYAVPTKDGWNVARVINSSLNVRVE